MIGLRRTREPSCSDAPPKVALGREDEAARWFRAYHHLDELLAPRFRRLAQIEDRRGNAEKAIAYYCRFVDLWKDSEPELRAQVDEAQERLTVLRQKGAASCL